MYDLQKAGLVAVCAIALCVLYAAAPVAQPACNWNLVPTPCCGAYIGVAALSSQDAYVLGRVGTDPFVIRWDGTEWTDVPLPDLGGDYDLRAMGGVAGRIYVAGVMPTGAFTSSQVFLGWNGTEWDVVEVFDLIPHQDGRGRTGAPRAIAGTSENDVWIIGTGQQMGTVPRTGSLMTLHWDGSQAEEILNLNVGDRQNDLYGVTAIAADDAWAVGYIVNWNSEPMGLHALVLHWDGTSWTPAANPAEPLVQTMFLDVAATAADDVWAVGDNWGDPLFMHYDGVEWTIVPGPPGQPRPYEVQAVSQTDVWAAGLGSQGYYHWDGSAWSIVPGAVIPGAVSETRAAIFASGECEVWTVGGWNDGIQGFTLVERLGPATVSGVGEDTPKSLAVVFRQSLPNPFSAVTRVEFELARRADVFIEVFDVTGRRVLTDLRPGLRAGPNSIELDGSSLRSGVHYCRVTAAGKSATRKIVVVR